MDIPRITLKKAKRLESKKKKAAAFLSLIGHKTMDTISGDTKTDNDSLKEEPVSEDVLAEMRKAVRERKKAAMQKPKVYLTREGMVQFRALPDQPVTEEEIPPLYVMDLQQLLLYGAQGNVASYKPRWCKLLRVGKVSSTVVLLLNGLSYNDFIDNKNNFPFIANTFSSYVEVVCPVQYMQTMEDELYNVPLSVSQLKKANVRVPQQIRNTVAAKIGQPTPNTGKDKFSRTCLLLSTYQMMLEGYPLPIHTSIDRYKAFVFTKDEYKKVTSESPIFAVDCEMCLTTAGRNELTRVSVISEKGEAIYDSLVKPKNRIINYLTRYSGITKEMLDPVTTTIADVQEKIRTVLPPDAILCGQSLNGDLLALEMFHPYVIDTSVIFNTSGNRGVKAGLRKLAQFFLGRSIQGSSDGHCSKEDATATLDLVKLKLTKGLEFGDATLSGVYFPDIHSYFFGEQNGKPAVSQNVEQDSPLNTQPSGVKETNSAVGALNKTEVGKDNPSFSQTSSVKDTEHSQNSSKRDHNGVHVNTTKNSEQASVNSSTERQSSASSSSSSSSEDESNPAETKSSAAKKRKLCDPDPGSATGESVTEKKGEQQTLDQELSGSKANTALQFSSTKFVKEQQVCLFSQENSVHVSHSLFQLVKEAGRPACLIDREPITSKFISEPIENITVATDTETRCKAKEAVKSKQFVWAQFHEFTDNSEAEPSRKQKLMRKLDKRVKHVMKHIRPNALVMVVMTGRLPDKVPNNTAAFITTT